MAFKKREVKREKSIFCLFILLLFIFSSLDFCFAQECEKKVMDACPNVETQPLGKTAACLEKNRPDIPEECHDGFQEFLDAYYGAKESCSADYKKLCKLDIEKMTPQTQYGPAWEECLFTKWGDFSEGCKDVFRGLPFFSEIEPGLEKISAHEKAKTRKKIRVRGTNQTVTSEYIDGNIVWYKARMKKKKVLERYEHCPAIGRNSGFKPVNLANVGICYYELDKSVIWDDDLLSKLDSAGYFEDKLKDVSLNDSRLRGAGIKERDLELMKIIEPYDQYCPEGFEIDVENFPRRKERKVWCAKKNSFICKEGFIRGRTVGEGCMKLASCEETSGQYESIGDKFECGLCYAGGCIDHERSLKNVHPLCKVNYKNPDQTPCEEYRVSRRFRDDGTLEAESFYKVNQRVKTVYYDNDGMMIFWREMSHMDTTGKPFKGYYADGRIKSEWVKDEEDSSKKRYTYYDYFGRVIDIDKLRVESKRDYVANKVIEQYRLEVDAEGRPLKKYTMRTFLLQKEWIRDKDGNVIKVIDYDEHGNVIKTENK